MTADKNDKKDMKPDYSLIPKVILDHLAYAMMAGEEKYGRYNYIKGHKLSQLTAAAVRHIKAIESGEDFDVDTTERLGVPVHHAGNVAACMLMLLHQRELGSLVDDRLKVKAVRAEKPAKVDTSSQPGYDIVKGGDYDVVRTPGGGEIRFHKK